MSLRCSSLVSLSGDTVAVGAVGRPTHRRAGHSTTTRLHLSTRRALEKHVDCIRSKLRPFGLTVPYATNYGYVLLHDDP